MARTCRRCDSPAVNEKGPPVCAVHRVPQGKNRPRKSMTCDDCGRRYTAASGARRCASCFHHASKHPCADCGTPVDKRAEVCRPCWGERHKGVASSRWKGGRIKNIPSGYVLVRINGHPRATKTNPYVREHVVVMEEMIGRYLLPGENVHHRNGVRDDNRPENLELWLVSQPQGQRAVDLLAWAREIVERYEPIESRLLSPR